MPLGILHRAAPCRNVQVTFTLDVMEGDSYRHRRARKFFLIAGGVLATVGGVDLALHGSGVLNLLVAVWGLLLWVPSAFFGAERFAKSVKWLERIMFPSIR